VLAGLTAIRPRSTALGSADEGHGGGRWETVRYALDSNARTIRLCLIVLVLICFPTIGVVIAQLVMRHLL
jgi:hypothetical protein